VTIWVLFSPSDKSAYNTSGETEITGGFNTLPFTGISIVPSSGSLVEKEIVLEKAPSVSVSKYRVSESLDSTGIDREGGENVK
jgi:hypothetical protein